MNDAVKGGVEEACKSQLWCTSKFISNEDRINDVCEVVISNMDDCMPKIFNPDRTQADKTLKMDPVEDFAHIHGSFIVSATNGFHCTTQGQVNVPCGIGLRPASLRITPIHVST
jgi:hypothetical protein